jgi:S-formylglutathione hydrolase FrmB
MATAFRTIELSDPRYTEPGFHFVTVKSAALHRRADVAVFVPPGYEGEALPRVILMHGVYGSHWAWTLKGGAHRVLMELMNAEEIPPMLLAMPSDGLWGDGSGYLAHRGADYARWIVEEVPAIAQIINPAGAQAKRFICGLSMGGYGALRLGAVHAGKFAGISAHSSITDYTQMRDFIEEPLESFELTGGSPSSVLEVMLANKSRLPPIRFDCGTEDGLIEYNRALHRDLDAAGIAHAYEEFPGAHTWEYWNEHLADSLKFFSGILRQ